MGKPSIPPAVDCVVLDNKRNAVFLFFNRFLETFAFTFAGKWKAILPDLATRDAREIIEKDLKIVIHKLMFLCVEILATAVGTVKVNV